MASRHLKLSIDVGSTTCASEPGKFCPYFGSMKFGCISCCCLFPSRDRAYTILYDKDGWVQRCQACLDAEVSDE